MLNTSFETSEGQISTDFDRDFEKNRKISAVVGL